VGDTFVPCGQTIGPFEPMDYPADYYLDDHHPLIGLDANTSDTG
jgi:hypothetical protein